MGASKDIFVDPEAVLRRDLSARRLLRPAVVALVLIVAAGILVGVVAFRLAGAGSTWPVSVSRTPGGWVVGSPGGFVDQSGEVLTGHYLVWDNGSSLELLDLHGGKVVELQAPPRDDTGGASAVASDRFVAWWTGDGAAGTTLRAYDLTRRHALVVTVSRDFAGDLALGDATLYWDRAAESASDPSRELIVGRDLTDGHSFTLAAGDVLLGDACGDLVSWTQSQGKRPDQQLTVVRDIVTARTWRLHLCPRGWQLDGWSLAGRSLVWEIEHDDAASVANQRIETLNLDSGTRRLVAQGKQIGQFSAGGDQIVWSVGDRLLLQSMGGGPVRALSSGSHFDDVPAISATTIAGEIGQTNGGAASIEETRLP